MDKESDEEITHDISREVVTCEALINTFDKSAPNGVQWFNKDLNSNFELTFKKNEIESDLANFTVTFSLNNDLFEPSTSYKCCTTLDDKPVRCKSVFLIQSPITTVEPITTKVYEQTTTDGSIILTTLTSTKSTTRTTTSNSNTICNSSTFFLSVILITKIFY